MAQIQALPGGAAAIVQGSGLATGGPVQSADKGRWEEGNPDYMGSASFDNILKKIETTMSSPGKLPFYYKIFKFIPSY